MFVFTGLVAVAFYLMLKSHYKEYGQYKNMFNDYDIEGMDMFRSVMIVLCGIYLVVITAVICFKYLV